ncbi:MAG: ribonuclease E activity regulator RraA [Bacteroidota bacterium]
MEIVTADLWDEHAPALRLLNLELKSYGRQTSFFGEIVTLKVFEDNSWVRKILAEKGDGKVLIVDGGGSKRCALVGDNIAQLAIENGWEGIIVYGCIRDSKVINEMDIGIKAVGTCPAKSIKRNVGVEGESLCIEGTDIVPGTYVYADEDGVLLSAENLL